MKVVLAGATGLIGTLVLDQLLAHPSHPQVLVLTRRPAGRQHAQLTEHVAAVADWPAWVRTAEADVAISTLGTTLRVAGSQAAFAAIDHDAVVDFATASRDGGARQFITVSSVGADAGASNFYLRTKGRVEEALRALAFARLDLVRPGLLRGDRKAFRLGERIAQGAQFVFDPLLRGNLSKYRSIDAAQVARAILACAMTPETGIFVHQYREIQALAAKTGI
jgi:uncharacterized protein YbjT (DUF2867 family)